MLDFYRVDCAGLLAYVYLDMSACYYRASLLRAM